MAVFKGAGVAIITPFNEDCSVNYEKFTEVIEEQIAGGTDAIIVCGTTGEAATLSHEEHLDVIAHCVKVVNGRIPVVAGTGSNCTDTAIYLTTEADKLGVDAMLVVTPYYNKSTQKGLYEHYKMVAESTDKPIIIYNVPSRTGCTIQPETIVKLCQDIPNIVGVKDATGSLSEVAHLAALAKGCVDIYSGNDDQIVPIMSLGGIGVISVLSNVAPKEAHNICQLMLDGKTAEAAAEQLRAIPMVDALFCEVNPIPVKKAMNLMGKNVGPMRRPLTEMEPEHAEAMAKVMKEYGIL